MAMGETANLIRNWRVHPDDFSSDHRLIKFGIMISSQPPMFSRNWKLGDFSISTKSLDEMMTAPLKSWSARILEGEVEHFHVSVRKALNKSHPVQPCRASLYKATWWNKEAGKLKREVKVSSSRFCRNRSEGNFSLLLAARRGFSKLTRKLKRKEWVKFFEEADSPEEMARLNKIFQGGRIRP